MGLRPGTGGFQQLRHRAADELFIGGKFVAPKSGKYFPSINPATEQTLTTIAAANEVDVDSAVKSARKAYDKVWSKMPGPRARPATILHLLGLDHKKLTFRFQGRDFRLTDVHGELVTKLLV